ncbi:baseplate J/gp47 family protein [Paenibacillus ginsengarvi]|uniref:Baseplate J/gp47 family protein n=1 Tax=Paenibacillus ginsengarvi TaxID=400777 RepID=A0A3B0CKV2_9BACL|nr:baseplate J/gp47 family protein [Paenibacillus ginsengarvi]RKN85862.1 baseplate J/gp47 family protein [Paenibacillus ginsengarvi]
MYETQTFEAILARMLARVPSDIDKREGGVIYNALAPAAAELAKLYVELDVNYNLTFADTASGEYLTRRTAEFGVNRRIATKAQRKGVFLDKANLLFDVPIGGRYGHNGVNYVVVSRISEGTFRLECETAGIVGNQSFGALLPVSYVSGLARAELSDILVPGEDTEADDALRARYYAIVNEPAYGGNVADYRRKIGAIQGVGAVKIFPSWAGGGTVKATIIASDWSEPTPMLINEVQTNVDPIASSGHGYGTAPIGHEVTIVGVSDMTIDVRATVILAPGTTVGQVQGDIEAAIDMYLLELRRDWANQSQLTVRVAQIDARILTVPGVEDVADTELNGSATNVTMAADEIPVSGGVTIDE